MTDTLATFAAQVSNVAHEVGVGGRLGNQANVPGASGTWKDLTAQRQPARRQPDDAGARHRGGRHRRRPRATSDPVDQVDASGEVAELKDHINAMIDNLRLTTERNQRAGLAQDATWPGSASLLQGQRDLAAVGQPAARQSSRSWWTLSRASCTIMRTTTRGVLAAPRSPRYADHGSRSAQGHARRWAKVWSGSAPSTEPRIV